MKHEVFLRLVSESFGGRTNADHPVHPVEIVNLTDGHKAQVFGLTKREEFAKAAMQGLLANPAGSLRYHSAAEEAVSWADSLITVLNKKGEEGEKGDDKTWVHEIVDFETLRNILRKDSQEKGEKDE